MVHLSETCLYDRSIPVSATLSLKFEHQNYR